MISGKIFGKATVLINSGRSLNKVKTVATRGLSSFQHQCITNSPTNHGLKLSVSVSRATIVNAQSSFHSSSAVYRDYSEVPEVFERIKSVASSKIVDQVKAIYLFDVDQKGKYYIDFKNGEGCVGEGDPANKPDVTISMNEEVFLKIFNREIAPATAFMTGKIKISGDLTKALTLEKVMVAAREARGK